MLFDLTEDQADFRAVVRTFLSQKMTPALLRSIWNKNGTEPSRLWESLAEMGILGLVVPDQYGGADASHVELALALEQAAYFGLPEPLLETAAVAAPLLVEFAPEDVCQRWLPRIVSGEAVVTVSLDGTGIAVHGARADAVIVARGTELHLVRAGILPWKPMKSQDPTRQLAIAGFDSLGGDTVFSSEPGAVQRALTLASSATAISLVGLSQRLLDMTLTYVLEREQFGQVIGSFQVLKHRLADIAVALEAARGLSWYSAYALSNETENATRAARTAKAAAGSAAGLANSGSLQLHGGIGFTWEHDLHLWLKKGRALEAAYGNASDHRVAIARALITELTPV
ncbi:acyl-CoA dehydrogenase family protein [soil metagenome]